MSAFLKVASYSFSNQRFLFSTIEPIHAGSGNEPYLP